MLFPKIKKGFAKSTLLVSILSVQGKTSHQQTHKPKGQHATCRHAAGVKGPHRGRMIPDDGFDEKTSRPLPSSSYHLLCSSPVCPLFLPPPLTLLHFHPRVTHQCDFLPCVFLNPRYVKALESSKASPCCSPPSPHAPQWPLPPPLPPPPTLFPRWSPSAVCRWCPAVRISLIRNLSSCPFWEQASPCFSRVHLKLKFTDI